MTQDLRDWYPYAPRGPLSPMLDLGEHAARLASIDTFDRLGDTVWFDDFEAGMGKWDGGFVAPAGFIRMNYTSSRNGLAAVVMQPGVGAGTTAYLEHYNPYTREGGISLEASWSLADNSGVIQQLLRVYSTVKSLNVGIRYNPVTDVLEYMVDPLTWKELDPAPGLERVFRLFHTCKIVVDTVKGEYVRIMLDNHFYDMKGIPIDDAGAAPTAYVWIQLLEEGGVAPVNYSYWDDVILKQNEP